MLILLLGLWSAPIWADASKVLSFGVVPQQSPSKLARAWGPILKEIGRRAGVKIVFKTAPDIPTFEQRLARGAYDIAYMNPYHYVEFHEKPGYVPLVRAPGRELRGILVVRKNAPYHSVSDLAGKTLAFPAPAAFAATVLIQAEFSRQHVAMTPQYVASHDSVYLDVAKGLFPAGGGITRTFKALHPQIRNALRVIYETPGYTPHAIAVSPSLPAETAARIRAAFVEMDKHPETAALLAPLKIKRWVVAKDSDWDDVRALCRTLPPRPFAR